MCSMLARKRREVGWAVWSDDDVIIKMEEGKLPYFGNWKGIDGDMETLGERRSQVYDSLCKRTPLTACCVCHPWALHKVTARIQLHTFPLADQTFAYRIGVHYPRPENRNLLPCGRLCCCISQSLQPLLQHEGAITHNLTPSGITRLPNHVDPQTHH